MEFLERVLPGKSGRVVLLRQQMLDFGFNPTARALLLLGTHRRWEVDHRSIALHS